MCTEVEVGEGFFVLFCLIFFFPPLKQKGNVPCTGTCCGCCVVRLAMLL